MSYESKVHELRIKSPWVTSQKSMSYESKVHELWRRKSMSYESKVHEFDFNWFQSSFNKKNINTMLPQCLFCLSLYMFLYKRWTESSVYITPVSVSAMLVDTHQKKYRSSFYSWAIFFCFHLSGSNSRYLLSGVLGGSTAALFITSDIYLKKSIPCSLHEHASE